MAKKKDSWGDAAANTPWSRRIPPAPGELRIVQAFVNTHDREAGTDELASPEALGNWFTRWGLAVGEIRISAADFKQALEVRQGLWSLIQLNWGAKVTPSVAERLDRLASEVPFRIRFGGAGAARLEAREAGFDGALGRLFKIVYLAQVEGVWDRLKTCWSGECSRTFYDFSTNRSARWCIKSICGDRINTRRHRNRRFH